MSQPHAQKNFIAGSSRPQRNPRTVLLRMAADQARADRIRQLKLDHPEYTWQAIADHVGVTLRAAQAWQETGGIGYNNAKRLADLWGEDVDLIMRGPKPGTPNLSLEQVRGEFRGDVDGVQSQLDRVELKLDTVLAYWRDAMSRVGEPEAFPAPPGGEVPPAQGQRPEPRTSDRERRQSPDRRRKSA